MSASIIHRITGCNLLAGKLAGRVLLAVPGLLLRIRSGRLGSAPAGARAAITTHGNTLRAPKEASPPPVFHCPHWPACGCPGGTMRPECPGLKSRVGTQ